MRLAYLMAVMALVLIIPAVSAQPNVPFCCGSPYGAPYMSGYGECLYFCEMWQGCYICDTSHFGYDCEGYYGYEYSCNQPESHESSSSVDFDSDCDSNVVTVDGAGDEAHVVVKDSSNNIIASGDTDGDVFTYAGCDLEDLTIKVTRSGYAVTELTGQSSVSCSECGNVTPGCTVDTDCLSNQECLSGECVAVQCSCGQITNHTCEAYACCSDTQCSANEVCSDHACKPKPTFECTADGQCAPSKYCDIPSGAAGGSCKDVPLGDCGKVENHAFVAYGYECGSEAGCPSCPDGSSCVEHTCVANDLTCPTTGIVGDKKTCEAKENGQACPLCDYIVTDPSGKNSTGRTDESGNFDLPLNMQGIYKVALIKNGTIVKVIEVKAFPQAQPDEPTKPAASGPDVGMIIALLVLLLLIVLGIVYWRSRGSKKK